MRLTEQKTWTGVFFLLPALLFLLAFFIYPFVFNISLSLKETTISSYANRSSPFAGFATYLKVFRNPVFWQAALNTLQFTFFSLALDFIIGFSLAILFNRVFPGSTLMRGLLAIPWFMPLITTASFFKWFLSNGGTLNALLKSAGIIKASIGWLTDPSIVLWSVTAINVWLGTPFVFILLHTGLQNIPPELHEAADIDGASGPRKTWSITIPCLRPVLLITLMLGTVYTIKHFDIVWITTQGGPGNASHLFSTLSYQLALRDYQFGSGAVVATVMVAFILVLVYLYSLIKME